MVQKRSDEFVKQNTHKMSDYNFISQVHKSIMAKSLFTQDVCTRMT